MSAGNPQTRALVMSALDGMRDSETLRADWTVGYDQSLLAAISDMCVEFELRRGREGEEDAAQYWAILQAEVLFALLCEGMGVDEIVALVALSMQAAAERHVIGGSL